MTRAHVLLRRMRRAICRRVGHLWQHLVDDRSRGIRHEVCDRCGRVRSGSQWEWVV